MSLKDLFTNPDTGRISHSELWANVAAAAATYKFVMLPQASYEIWLAYLGIVGGYAISRRWIVSSEIKQRSSNARTK